MMSNFRRLNKIRKLRNIERQKRMEEYRREELAARVLYRVQRLSFLKPGTWKVREVEDRSRNLLEAKHDLMRQRQKNQIRAQLQKQQVPWLSLK